MTLKWQRVIDMSKLKVEGIIRLNPEAEVPSFCIKVSSIYTAVDYLGPYCHIIYYEKYVCYAGEIITEQEVTYNEDGEGYKTFTKDLLYLSNNPNSWIEKLILGEMVKAEDIEDACKCSPPERKPLFQQFTCFSYWHCLTCKKEIV